MSRLFPLSLAVLAMGLSGCGKAELSSAANYREFAYITNGGSNSVSVYDVVNMRQDRVIGVGVQPTGIAANPHRNELYVVNSGSNTVTVIDAQSNTAVATIPVHRRPYFIDVDRQGRRGYVANSGSHNISVLDLISRREIGVIAVDQGPGVVRISPDGKTLVISNRISGSVSIADPRTLEVRSSFDGCPGATDAVILPDSSKALIACSGSHHVMVVGLAHSNGPDPWATDRLLTFLDVGTTPLQLALKPDGGEVFVSNFNSGTVSEIGTSDNEVGGAFLVGPQPDRGLVSADNSLLYISDFNTSTLEVYSIDDGKLVGSGVRVGEGPDAMAFAASGRLLFVVDSQSGDVAILRTQSAPPSLLTLFPVGRSPNAIAVKAFLAP